MKNILIIMIAAVLILSAFDVPFPKYGLYYEIVLEKVFDKVDGLMEAGAFIFSGKDGILNSLFDITNIPEVVLTSDSILRLLQYEDSYMVEVVSEQNLPELDPDVTLKPDWQVPLLCSNIPDLYYVNSTWDRDAYKLFNIRQEMFWKIDSNTITFSGLYSYSDFITFLRENHPIIAEEIIDVMQASYVGD